MKHLKSKKKVLNISENEPMDHESASMKFILKASHRSVCVINFPKLMWIICSSVKLPNNGAKSENAPNEFLCLWLAQMRREKGTCTGARRAHVMLPVHG